MSFVQRDELSLQQRDMLPHLRRLFGKLGAFCLTLVDAVSTFLITRGQLFGVSFVSCDLPLLSLKRLIKLVEFQLCGSPFVVDHSESRKRCRLLTTQPDDF